MLISTAPLRKIHTEQLPSSPPSPLPAHTSTLYNCNRTQQNEETPPFPALHHAMNIIKIEMLFLGHRTVHKVGNYSLGQLGSAWASTAQNVLCNIFSFHRVYFRIFFQDIKLQKNFSFSSSRNPSWNSDTESSHRPTQTTLVRNALMQCRVKKEENWQKNCHLPIFGMVGVGEDVSRGSAVLTRKKSAKKINKNESISLIR